MTRRWGQTKRLHKNEQNKNKFKAFIDLFGITEECFNFAYNDYMEIISKPQAHRLQICIGYIECVTGIKNTNKSLVRLLPAIVTKIEDDLYSIHIQENSYVMRVIM